MYSAFLAGGNAVIEDQNYLNKINVFPIPDADTGTNLASTMRSIAEEATAHRSLKTTLHSIADAALSGARGNSGLIFAQFLHGFSKELKNEMKVSTISFGESAKRAIQYAYKSIISPVEGTMLTVMKDWAEAVYLQRTKTGDFVELLSDSLQIAEKSLKDTPKKLAVLAKAGVVDAGAKGFVDFLEGILNFIKKGKLRHIPKTKILWKDSEIHVHTDRRLIDQRYCSEALLVGKNMDLNKLRSEIPLFGKSAIVAGSEEKVRIHVHTNTPTDLFFRLKDFGSITQIKVDDMLKKYEASHNKKSKIALVTDSSCDLPQEMIDELQIQVIPINLSFGDTLFLDKVTITPDQFYTMLGTHKEHPKTSQPPLKSVQNLLSFLASHYESIIVINLSDKLSGIHKLCLSAASAVQIKKIKVIDSKNISVTLGLIILRVAEAIRGGKSYEEILRLAEEWISKTKVLVDIKTIKYLVRSGRVSPMKGFLSKMLNLKPIISIDSEGKSTSFGKSFSRKNNMKKIIQTIKEMSEKSDIWNYAIVHAQNRERAELYVEKLQEAIHLDPAFILDVSPVIGVHTGIGTLGIGVMTQ